MKNIPTTYCSKNEFSGYMDQTISVTTDLEITTSSNIDTELIYFKIYRLPETSGPVCRIFLNKPEYFYSDFYLTKKEKEELLSLLPNIWNNIISITNEDRKLDNLLLIDNNLPIPNYHLLETED